MLRHNGAKKEWVVRLAETHTQGERDRLPKRPMKMVFTPFLRVWRIPIGWEAPEGIRVNMRLFVNV